MVLPTNPELLKLRLKLNRARRDRDELEASIRDPLSRVNVEITVLESEFYRRWRDLGYCSHCEKSLDECECILCASPGYVYVEPDYRTDGGMEG